MHTFSLHTHDDEHIGFVAMLPDDEAQSGQLAIRLLSELPPHLGNVLGDLPHLAQQTDLHWHIDGDKVWVNDADGQNWGSIQQEIFRVGKQYFILNDLTGAI
ncbi:HLGFF motif protein [Alysiella filiformis]|uniref:Uncharacterized protein n=1 Tax=Alysiella filiformis DSM 16848 TaxID=1120981 RepID=A0A286EFC8_9NEIS|nr:hypothetical protein [Alysiella filiformis]QMT30675.1 hypothetical protein H3L97_07955 [Alysiella filiformis]UBQ56347.1 hypothetical protein JF568_00735 [Alysiella filiformis DSM 16848]SOD69611.1 hypothetical protein SAMN02746062_01759 [Alysiella filiformis DSM 16848]